MANYLMDKSTYLYNFLKEYTKCENIYFQPPQDTQMNYPAIKYTRNKVDKRYADNDTYNKRMQYTLTVIDYDPDSAITDLLLDLPNVEYDRPYVADGLHHDTLTITY